MSQGLLRTASKRRKYPSKERATLRYSKVRNYKKQEEKRKLNRKTGKELSNDELCTINLYPVSECRHHWRAPFSVIKKMGLGDVHPPPFHFTLNREYQKYVFEC